MLFEFVQASESDKKYLLDLRIKTMTQHLKTSGLCLTLNEHVRRLNHKYECSHLIFHSGKRIGHIKFESKEVEFELIQIQLEPQFQGKGYGSRIIETLLDIAAEKSVKLSVLKTNSATQLYQRLGFKIIGEDSYEY